MVDPYKIITHSKELFVYINNEVKNQLSSSQQVLML